MTQIFLTSNLTIFLPDSSVPGQSSNDFIRSTLLCYRFPWPWLLPFFFGLRCRESSIFNVYSHSSALFTSLTRVSTDRTRRPPMCHESKRLHPLDPSLSPTLHPHTLLLFLSTTQVKTLTTPGHLVGSGSQKRYEKDIKVFLGKQVIKKHCTYVGTLIYLVGPPFVF